jgi:hypothetical protein
VFDHLCARVIAMLSPRPRNFPKIAFAIALAILALALAGASLL